MWKNKAYMERRKALADIATETKEMTPAIAAQLPHLNPTASESIDLASLPPLDPTKCPGFIVSDGAGRNLGTTIRVFNQDALDAAICMPREVLDHASNPDTEEGSTGKETNTSETEMALLKKLKPSSSFPEHLNPKAATRIAVLNMASEFNPGGGWLKGSTAQEEAICYRSTLAASLRKERDYPIPARTGIYTPDVVIFRRAMGGEGGHGLMVPETKAEELPVVSVVSVPGLRRPAVKEVDEFGNVIEEGSVQGDGGDQEVDAKEYSAEGGSGSGSGSGVEGDSGSGIASDGQSTGTEGHSKRFNNNKKKNNNNSNKKKKGGRKKREFIFAQQSDRDLTKDKMRLCLRIAASKGHGMLILGAMGCGAFRNPPKEISSCWMEVLEEDEFGGGWFKEIWFAVFDRRNEGNFEVFRDKFDGKVVGVRSKD